MFIGQTFLVDYTNWWAYSVNIVYSHHDLLTLSSELIKSRWDQLGRAVNERVQPGDTLADLRRYVMEEWLNIPQVRVHNLIRSIGRRCVALCVSRGGYTRY